jgi:3-methyladenine DNA glycosylase Tag
MQNTKYQLLWNDRMQNAKILRVMFSSIQNAEFIARVRASRGSFGGFFLPLKSKMENNHLFAKFFVLVPFCKMMNQNPKFFGTGGKLNTP